MSIPTDQITGSLREKIADAVLATAEQEANEQSGVGEDYSPAQPMTESEIQGVIKQMLQDSSGGGDTDDRGVSGSLSLALNYYFGRPRGDEIEGRSEQQSLDVADMVEAVLAEVTPIFSGDTIVMFNALSEEDEDQAQEESKVINHVVMQQNNGYMLLYTVLKDALLQKNGIVEVYVDEKYEVRVEEYEGLSELERLAVMQPQGPNEQVILTNERSSEQGFDLEIKRVTKTRELKVEAVPPEDFHYYTAQDSTHLRDCPFTARRMVVLRSDLIAKGYDPEIVDRLPPYTSKDDQVSVSRNQFGVQDASRYTLSHHSTDPIEIYRCYARIDEDGDGIAEFRRIIVAGRSAFEILEDIPWNHVAFAAGTAYIQPHRFLGMSLFDKLWDVQDGKTTVLRQYEDNLSAMNDSQTALDYTGVGDIDTWVNTRPGGIKTTNRDPRTVAMPLTPTNVGPTCIQAMDYYDRIAARRAGSSLDIQSRAASIPGGIGSQGLDRLMTAEERMAAMMARNVGETLVRDMYLLVHRVARESYRTPLSVKVGSQWIISDPSRWPVRQEVEVTVGKSGPERMREMSTLERVLEQQMKVLEQGGDGILTDHSKLHNTLVDYARLGNLSHPDRYWIDPESPQATQRKQQNAEQAQQQMAMQQEQAASQAGIQLQLVQAELGKAQAQMLRVRLQGQVEMMKQRIAQLQSLDDSSRGSRELALEYAKLVDQHQRWLTELEVQTGQELSARAAENVPGGAV